NNAFDDPLTLGVLTATAAPMVIPPTPVRPSRPQLVTAFTGTMEPASVPAYSSFACVMAGTDSLTPSPPLPPVDGGPTPTITLPGGPSTGPPLVTFADRLDRATLPFGLAIGELIATDGTGRKWRVIYEDGDGQGGTRTVQFPALGTSLTGLATGTWQIHA